MSDNKLIPLLNEEKYILDVCCGARMFYYDKTSPHVYYMDKRSGTFQLTSGKTVEILPDIVASFEAIPFPSESFRLVIFDPPHLRNRGAKSNMSKWYGELYRGWQDEIANGFKECFRVLENHGILLFKWCEADIKLSVVLELCPYRPLLGTRTNTKTAFITFLKEEDMQK